MLKVIPKQRIRTELQHHQKDATSLLRLMGSPQQDAILLSVLSFLWATVETGVRGFLLGFGASLLKDLMMREHPEKPEQLGEKRIPPQDVTKNEHVEKPVTPQDVVKNVSHVPDITTSFIKARMCGLGMACFLVGSSILLPASVRQKLMTS